MHTLISSLNYWFNSYGILPLTLKDDIDMPRINMCSYMRYTCMPVTKSLTLFVKKL